MEEIKKENKILSKEAKLLLLKILKQGYAMPGQIKELSKRIDLPMLQIEIIDKTETIK